MAFRLRCGLLALGIALPCAGAPQKAAPPPSGLADASLEELMNIEVTSVSKKAQRVATTAASVFVITAEDIRRSGITVLPEMLRLVPGVQVARVSSGAWAISIRGFNDQFSNKLLVLVDGRSVYTETFAGVYWDTLNVTPDTIERIEVIRGPGAAMWGTNAVNGVINIITKSAKATQGGLITAEAGSQAESSASLRYGGAASSNAFYRIGIQGTDQNPFPIVGAPTPSRGWTNGNVDFRFDWDPTSRDSVSLSGGAFRSNFGLTIPGSTAANPGAPSQDGQDAAQGENLLARWQHVFSETSSLEAQFSVDYSRHVDPQAILGARIFSYGFQQHQMAGSRHDVIWGVNIREGGFDLIPTPSFHFHPADTNRNEIDFFAEDEITLVRDKLSLIVGAQVGHINAIGYSVQPTGRLLWTPSKNLSSWIAVSRAVRTPSLSEQGLDLYDTAIVIPSASGSLPIVPHIMGNPAARSESVLAYEAGQRLQIAKRISIDASAFYNLYQHLSSTLTGAPFLAFSSGVPYLEIPVNIGNTQYGESFGGELATTWSATSRWRLTAGYSRLRVQTHSYSGGPSHDELATNTTPENQWESRSNLDLTRTVQVDAALYYYGDTPIAGIPRHLRGDLRIGWRPSPKFEASIGVQDAFEANHVEYQATRFGQISPVPRNFYGRLTWRW